MVNKITKKDRELLNEVLENREELLFMFKMGFIDGWKRAKKVWGAQDETIWQLVHKRCWVAFNKRFRNMALGVRRSENRDIRKQRSKDQKTPKTSPTESKTSQTR